MSIHPWWRLAAENPVAPARKRLVSCLAAVLVLFAAATQAGTLSPQRLVEVADLSSPVVSPAGTHVAFRMEQASVGRNTYDCFWYVQALDTAAAPLRVADCGIVLRDSAAQPLPALMRWSPDGAWIYFLAMLEGRVDVWRAAADGSGASALTHDHADVIEFALSSDGKQLSYRVGASREQVSRAELEEYQKGVRVDASLPVGQGVFRSGMVGGRPATQRLDTWFDRVPLLANAPRQWKVIELASGVQRDLAASQLPPKPLEVSDLQSRWPDVWKLEQQPSSGKVAVLIRQGERGGYRDRPEVQLSVLANARSQQPIPCISPLCTGKAITRMQWLPGGDELLYAVTRREQGQAQSLYRWNVRTGQVDEVASSSGLLSGGRDQNSPCGASADTLVCVAAEAGRPPYLISLGLKKPSTRVLFEPNQRLAQDISRTMPVRLLQWKDEQGESFSGQFYPAQQVPEGGAPLFITYYTCPGFVRGGLGDEWPLLSLAERGISALCINAAPYRLDASSRYGAGLSAVESVVKLLASEGKVDRTRVGMGGLSFGTEMTLWTMMHSDLLAAASIASPGISRQYYLLGSLRGDIFFAGLQRSWQAAAPEKTPERWQLLSPDMNLDRFRAPLLMQLSEQEYIFTLDFSIPLVRDQRADMYLFPNEPHQKFQPQHKLAVYERNLDWFSYWLTGYEDPAPAKVDQYRHWQSMKTRFEAERGQRR